MHMYKKKNFTLYCDHGIIWLQPCVLNIQYTGKCRISRWAEKSGWTWAKVQVHASLSLGDHCYQYLIIIITIIIIM